MRFGISQKRFTWVFTLTVVISLLHYNTNFTRTLEHAFYREFYFIPLLLASFWFGVKGGLIASFGIALIYLPFLLGHPNANPAGRFDGLMAVVLFFVLSTVVGKLRDREIVHQKRLRESENLAVMGKAISCLAHDIKSPLLAIGGFANSMKKHLPPDDPNRRKLDFIVRQVKRLETMVKEMLIFSKPLNLNKSFTDVNNILEEAVVVIEEEARRRGVCIRLCLNETGLWANVDAMRLEQALINLGLNAVQATNQGDSVILRTSVNGKDVIIEVIDRGVGIAGENHSEIVNSFFTNKQEGTGLGLPIAKKVVEAHRGRLDYWNNMDGGATFRMQLPMD